MYIKRLASGARASAIPSGAYSSVVASEALARVCTLQGRVFIAPQPQPYRLAVTLAAGRIYGT
jgi:hypothetical protein